MARRIKSFTSEGNVSLSRVPPARDFHPEKQPVFQAFAGFAAGPGYEFGPKPVRRIARHPTGLHSNHFPAALPSKSIPPRKGPGLRPRGPHPGPH